VQSSEKYSGTYAAKSGAIGDNTNTELSLSLNITSSGNISFYQKISSESGYDFLRFFIDGVQQGEWSGSGSWTQQSYAVTTGTHTFLWRYLKDVNTVSGSDCAWIDHLNFPAFNNFYAPTNLTGIAGNSTASLSWSAPGGNTPTRYNIYRNTSLIGNSVSTNYTDNSVSNGVPYTYYVTAVYSSPSGESSASNSVTLTPGAVVVNDYVIGTGTSTTGTSSACPINIYYESLHGQSVYTAAELNAAGITGPIDITRIGFYINTAPSEALPNFIIRMKHTTATNVASWQTADGMATVYSSSSYLPVAGGFQMLDLTTPFTWNGTSNLVVDTAFSPVNQWTSTGTVRYSTVTSGYRYTRADDADQTNVFSGSGTNNTTSTNRPNIKLTTSYVPPTPAIVVQPSSLAYGTIRINTTSAYTFQISNPGTATLTGTITTPSGYSVALSRQGVTMSKGMTGLSNNRAETRNSLGYSIPAGGNSTFNVSFTPTAVQAYNGNITITHNAGGADRTIALTGQGGKPTLSLSSTTFTANLGLNGTGSDNLAVSNSGNLELSYNLAIAGSVPWLSINGGSSASGTIAVGGAAQNVSLAFNAAGLTPGTYNATINGSSDDPSAATYSIDLTLNVLAPLIEVSTNALDFGTVLVNQTATQNFTISNPGTSTLTGQIVYPSTVYSVAATRALRSSESTLYASSQSDPSLRSTLSYNLSAGESQGYSVVFAPTNIMVYDDQITISHNAAGGDVYIDLNGIGGQAVLDYHPSQIEIELPLGSNDTVGLYLGNLGNIPLTYSAVRSPGSFSFTIDGSPSANGSIPAGSSQTLEIGIPAQTTSGQYTGGIDITSNDPDNPSLRIPVVLNVFNPNHPPVINLPSIFELPYNGNQEVNWSAFASDPDNDTLVYTITTSSHITYTSLTYPNGRLTPNPGWHGQEFVHVTVSDGEFEASDDMLVIVNGPPVLDIPVDISFGRNGSINVDFGDYLADPEMDELVLSFSGNSSIQIDQLGMRVMFSSLDDYVGSEAITLTVYDGHNTVQGEFTVTVINHEPVINLPESFSLDQNGSLTVDFSPLISDADGDTLTLSHSGNSNIGVSIDGFSVTFTPAADWFGSEDITFTLSDGLIQSNAAVQVTVNQVISHLDTPELLISANINGIHLTWQPVNYATEYQIYRASSPEGSYSLLDTTSSTQYNDNNPPDLAFYYVKAVYMPLSGK
jgi:fibronectin type 3 domain-containing protein